MLNFDFRCTGNGAYDRLLLSSDTLYVESGSLVKRRLGKRDHSWNVCCLERGRCFGVAVWSLEEWRPGSGEVLGSGVVLAVEFEKGMHQG